MELPFKRLATIERKKISDYLLSLSHPVGKGKAIFFRKIGFNDENLELFEKELFKIAHTEKVIKQEPNNWGVNYVIEGEIRAPDGQNYKVRTVWFISSKSKVPSFTTAYHV